MVLGNGTSTQHSKVQSLNPEKKCFRKKHNFLSMGSIPGQPQDRRHKVKSSRSPWTFRQNETLLTNTLLPELLTVTHPIQRRDTNPSLCNQQSLKLALCNTLTTELPSEGDIFIEFVYLYTKIRVQAFKFSDCNISCSLR